MKNNLLIGLVVLFAFACTNSEQTDDTKAELNKLQSEVDSLYNYIGSSEGQEKDQIATFLMFQNEDAEQAMNFYIELFDNSKIVEVSRWGKEGPGKEGTIMVATFNLNGRPYMCSDSPIKHEWNFTPGVSNFVECMNQNELEELFNKLSDNGKVLMPLDNYGFSQQFGFVEDKFGVSWQLNLK